MKHAILFALITVLGRVASAEAGLSLRVEHEQSSGHPVIATLTLSNSGPALLALRVWGPEGCPDFSYFAGRIRRPDGQEEAAVVFSGPWLSGSPRFLQVAPGSSTSFPAMLTSHPIPAGWGAGVRVFHERHFLFDEGEYSVKVAFESAYRLAKQGRPEGAGVLVARLGDKRSRALAAAGLYAVRNIEPARTAIAEVLDGRDKGLSDYLARMFALFGREDPK